MLKRHQVLLENWQTDYLKKMSEVYDISFSETVRVAMSLGFLCGIAAVYPQYKHRLDKKLLSKLAHQGHPSEEMHKMLSTLYFESRKATEFRLAKMAKRTGKS